MMRFGLFLIMSLLIQVHVHAEDTYKFSIGEPAAKPKGTASKGGEEEYPAIPTFYGYPRFEYGLAYNPSFVGFKQSLGSLQYNIAGYNYMTLSTYATIQFRPENSITLSASFMQLATKEKDFSGVGLKSSEANILTMQASFDHCFFFDNFYNRMCVGPQFGVDGFPVLDFISNTEMRLTQLRDMMAGLHLNYYYPVNKNFVSKTNISYDYGLTQGQNETLRLTADAKLALATVVEWPHGDKAFWHVGLGVENRSAKFTNNLNDSWKTEMLNYTIMAGYKWMTGPAQGQY